ncbi:MAG TPA: HRDC domain-containing protein, partial [Chthonomonadaceae bacterium]|nr:HRDC domain-containing protein [Chthonomonadaceae bacterium]
AKMRRLVSIARETAGAGIIYANSRERCEQLAAMLRKQGISAAFYHAGLDRETRRATQESFMLGRTRVMVATVAFGMGVDKSNVRFVVHFTLPESLEAYTQEAGRAGRDGKPSRCVLLIAPSDRANLIRWLRQNQVTLPDVRETYRALKARIGRGAGVVSPDEIQAAVFGEAADDPRYATRLRVAISMLERCGLLKRHVESGHAFHIEIPPAPPEARAALDALLEARREHEERRLADMLGYAEGSECRHVVLARHFDQELAPCGDACDRCLGVAQEAAAPRATAPTSAEVPDVGRVILDCIASLPYPLGRTGVAKVVTGAADSPLPAERCTNHGVLAGCTLKAVRGFLDTLVEQELLHLDREAEYPLLHLTPQGRSALRTEEEILANPLKVVTAARTTSPPLRAANASLPSADAPLAADEDERFERLRAWRRIEAARQKVPPYVLFHDATLRTIAQVNPTDLNVLSQIPGIGPRKLESYGEAVLELLHGVSNPVE